MQLIENLKWRYATKMFDATKKVSEDKIDQIKMAIQLSASSYGQQPYLILEVKTPEVREALKPLCWNHAQIVDASHLFVFCNKIENTDEDVDDSTHLKSDVCKIPFEKIASQPTISRFENCFDKANIFSLCYDFIDRYVESLEGRDEIVIDATDDPTHGKQQLTMFNTLHTLQN